jgi:hypothetical protein
MLSRIPLRWILRQAFACDTGILFHSDVLAEHGMDVDSLWPVLQQRTAPLGGPAPSALDLYATNKLPSLDVRREFIRRRSCVYDDSSSPTSRWSPCSNHLDPRLEKELSFIPEDHEDYFDALSPIHDQLKNASPWWILEFLPFRCKVKTSDGRGWRKKTGCNRGRHRAICDLEPSMHWTVAERERVQRYSIKCQTDTDVQWKIVI